METLYLRFVGLQKYVRNNFYYTRSDRIISKSKTSTYLSIQYLRAIGAIMVVLYHAIPPVYADVFPATALSFLPAGVDIFFVISGFIIYTSQKGRTDGALAFAKRRFIRVVPIYWIVTAALIILHLKIGIAAELSLDPAHVIKSFLFIPHYSPSYPESIWPLLVPGWSLFYEVFFYTLMAVSIAVSHRRFVLVLLFALMLLIVSGRIIEPTSPVALTYTSPLLLEFAAGIGIAMMAERNWLRASLWPLLVVGSAGLIASGITDLPREVEWGIPAALIVIGFVAIERSLPDWRGWHLIGNASYSIYLTHLLTLSFARGIWRAIGPQAVSPASLPAFLVFGVAASVAVGIGCYYGLERPIMGLYKARSARR